MDAMDVKRRMVETLRRFDTLMVATRASNGTLHARPMMVADVGAGGEIWFVTPRESDKVDEITMDPTAVATGQDSRSWVSLSGRLEIVDDAERAQGLWSSDWEVWFPEGHEPEDVTLIRLRPEIGEYWRQGMLEGVRHVFEATWALFGGHRDEARGHAKVPM